MSTGQDSIDNDTPLLCSEFSYTRENYTRYSSIKFKLINANVEQSINSSKVQNVTDLNDVKMK